jgi:hypothetical protein
LGNHNGDIAVLAGGGVTLSSAQIGNDSGSTGGTVLVTSGGNLTLAGGASINANASGDALVLAAAGDFINQAGGSALNVSGGGRWLAFLRDPANNIAGGINASPFYNRTFDFLTGSYAAIAATGNRFVYALAPTLNVALDNKAKTYRSGNPALTATITGLLGGDTLAGAVTGMPSFSTTATANSAVGDYAIIGALGTFASDFNYGFQFANGTLHIDPATLTYTANAVNRTYGSANPGFSGTLTGFLNGETQASATGETLTFASPATAASHVGSYAVNGSGLTANNGNYNFVQASGNAAALTIDPATLTYAASAASRAYGSANPTLSGTLTGFVNGETQASATGGTLIFASPATAANKVGSYAINGSGVTANNGDYNFVQAASNATALTIDPATLTAGLTGSVAKTYDGTDAATLASSNYALVGVVSGDSVALNNPASGRYDDKEVGSGKLVTASGLALSGNDAGNYVLGSTQASGNIGVITRPLIDNGILANLTGRPTTNTAAAVAPAIVNAADAQDTSDATSATSEISEESAPANAVANSVGQSLSGVAGSVPSWTNVLIEGLLRQFEPPPGSIRPRGVPSVDQIYSSWGNEAFWQ